MKHFLVAAAALLATPSAAQAQSVRTVEERTPIDWSYAREPNPVRYRVGDVMLTVHGRREADMPDLIVPVLRVAMPGLAPVEAEGSPTGEGFEHRITVDRWDAERRYVLFQSFSGGAHCCNMIQLILPEDGRLQRIELGEWDGGYLDEMPTDLDGDGRIDFVLRDDVFLYAFTSYAESFPPPQVINIVGGSPVDVSASPAFRPLFESAMADARPLCVEEHANGACAAYVATAARVGRLDQAWAEMLQAYHRDADWPFPVECRVTAAEGQCPEGQRIETYPDALRQFLIDHGYIED